MDSVTYPLAEISVGKHASLLRVFVNDYFLQVIVIHNALFLSEVAKNVFNSNISIMI